MIDLYDVKGGEVRQLRRTLDYGRAKIAALEERRTEIAQALHELKGWERRLAERLDTIVAQPIPRRRVDGRP